MTHPWLAKYPQSIQWDTEIPSHPVHQILEKTAKKYPDAPAINFLGFKQTWADIDTASCQLAKGLQDEGIGKGDKVGIFLPNCPLFMIAYYGILRTGATAVNMNPLYAEREIADMIEDSEADFVITLDLKILFDKMHKMLHETRLRRLIVANFTDMLAFPKNILFKTVKGKEIAKVPEARRILSYKNITKNNGDYQQVEIKPQEDIALLQYTGGTTGLPKGAMLTHANVVANAEQATMWIGCKEQEEKMLGVLPFFHVFAMTAVMNMAVRNAMEIITIPRFELDQTLKLIHKYRPTIFPAVPAILNAINTHKDLQKYDLSSLKYCISGGAPLPVEVKRKFEEKTGSIVVEGYGLSESSPVLCCNPAEGENKPGSIGLPFPQTVIEIIDPETGETCPIGERGELCASGPQVMKGYWKRDQETANTLKNGLLHTGDIATMDEEGYVFIVDRIKDMIITNGYNVYPRNVEEAIYEHPSVEECIVAGIPDPQRGEMVKAWIKRREGRELSADDLKSFLKDKISPLEMPKRIEFREEPLPKTMIGKLSRKDVVAQELEQSEQTES